MAKVDKDAKQQVLYGLCDVIAAIDRDPSFLTAVQFWGIVERLNTAIAVLEQIPEKEMVVYLNSPSALAIYNECMRDWSASIMPMDGWCDHLTSRLPAFSLPNRSAEIDIYP